MIELKIGDHIKAFEVSYGHQKTPRCIVGIVESIQDDVIGVKSVEKIPGSDTGIEYHTWYHRKQIRKLKLKTKPREWWIIAKDLWTNNPSGDVISNAEIPPHENMIRVREICKK